MNVTFNCPKCDQTDRVDVQPGDSEYRCGQCAQTIRIPADAFAIDPPTGKQAGDVRLHRCLACPSTDLFSRKDFPQRLGVGIVTIGFVLSSIAWGMNRPILTYAILFATAGVDVLLYVLMPNVLMCYRCGAQYRGLADAEDYQAFELETHERHRQQKIRLAEHQHSAPQHPLANPNSST